jgi:glycerol uptake facilitator-like aquaporin
VRVTTPTTPLWRRLLAELLGTGLLVAVVVGSGIAASRLSPADIGLQLLENSIATALGLAVIILLLSPISAHLNPVVTLVAAVLERGRAVDAVAYAVAQTAGGVLGALLANAMFGLPPAIATTERASSGILLGEVVATAVLVLLVFSLVRTGRSALVAPAVGANKRGADWFTSSTSFANPAVTVGRVFSDTFAGIAPTSVLPFLAAQLVGAAVGAALLLALFPAPRTITKGTP